MYKVIFLCPDTNFVFDGRTPDSTGLGGGKTAFVRLARALADLGHDVTVYANCTPGVYDGVEYRHFDAIVAGACDVLVVMSTYAPDLSALDLGRLNARLRIVWVQGRTPINGLDRVPYDWLYAVSDYIKGVAVREWGADAHRVFVTHNAYDERNLARGARRAPARDPFAVVFSSHPSKGLDRIAEIVQMLRLHDERYHLDVYGGNALWQAGATESGAPALPGVRDCGMISQPELAARYYGYGLMLALSSVPDASSLTLAEAKKAGVIIIASDVGSNAEVIRDGYDGFVIREGYLSQEAGDKTIGLVRRLQADPALAESIRRNAMAYPRSWDVVAREWVAHWHAVLREEGEMTPRVSVVMVADGHSPQLRPAIDSILAQSFSDLELIVAADEGVNEVTRVVNSYVDGRIVVANSGVASTKLSLDSALALARGEYVARMDADGISAPDRLARQVQYLDQHQDIALLGAQYSTWEALTGVPGTSALPLTDADLKAALAAGEDCFCLGSVMMRRQAVHRVGGYRNGTAQDLDLFLRLSERHGIANLGDVLYAQRQTHNASVSGAMANTPLAAQARELALERYMWGRDRLGYPADELWLGVPATCRHQSAARHYAQTLRAWQRQLATSDFAGTYRLALRALVLDPADPMVWVALKEAQDARLRTEDFVLVIPVYNAEPYIGRCIDSVLSQTGVRWGAVIIDDHSTDRTLDIIREKTGGDGRFTVVANAERRFALYNVDQAITHYCGSGLSVIGWLAGDDWLADQEALDKMMKVHESYDLVWSNFEIYPSGARGFGDRLPPGADVRRYPWVLSQFSTFKKYLFDLIDKRSFLDEDGCYYAAACDQALFLPMLEIAGPSRRRYLDEILYVYNRENPLNVSKINLARQVAAVAGIRSRPPYPCLYPLSDRELAEQLPAAWRRYGAPDGVLQVLDSDTIELRFASPDPQFGDRVGASRQMPAARGQRNALSLQLHDHYGKTDYPGRFERRIYIDDKLIWQRDICADSFTGWRTVELAFDASADHIVLSVETIAVGRPEAGWKWGEAAATMVSGLTVQATDTAALQPASIVVSGYFGFNNVGDEAILAAMIEQLRRRLPQCSICVVSDNPQATSLLHGVAAIPRLDLDAVRVAVQQADLVISGGGGLLQDYDGFDPADLYRQAPYGIGFYAAIPLLARSLGKPVMIFAQGIGPLLSDQARRFVAFLCQNVDLATVRDAESRDLLVKIGAPVHKLELTADATWAWSPSVSAESEARIAAALAELGPGHVLAVSLREWSRGGVSNESWQIATAQALDRMVESLGFSVVFVPFHQGAGIDDRATAQAVRSRMARQERALVWPDDLSPAQAACLISHCALLVGMRLHALILAAKAGLPLVAMPYDDKVRQVMRQLGQETLCFDLAEPHADDLVRLVEDAWQRRTEIVANLQPVVAAQTSLAERNADLAAELVAQGLARAPGAELTDNSALAAEVGELQARVAALSEERAQAALERADLRAKLDEQEKENAVLQAKVSTWRTHAELTSGDLMTIQRSRAWRVAVVLWKVRDRLRPLVYRLMAVRARLRSMLRLEPSSPPGAPAQSVAHQGADYAGQLATVSEQARRSKGAVIFLPSVGWNIPLAQRPHHLARELARQGYIAIFDCSNAWDAVDGFKEIEPNLYLFRGDEALLHQIENPVLWAFSYNYDRVSAYPGRPRVIYDWIDDLEVFEYDRRFLERNHQAALRQATVVASVARRLHDQALAVRPDALYLPNGVEYPRFADPSVSPPNDPAIDALRKQGKPVAGYYGALARWFDYALLEETARLRPDWNFLLIGPMYDDSLRDQPLLDLPNVVWTGPRDYATMPGYLSFFDVATIPFAINNITLATSPLKLYEYFAGGKPVITTAMPECQSFAEVTIVQDAHGFAAALDAARVHGQDPAWAAHLQALAQQHSWTARVNTVTHHLQIAVESVEHSRQHPSVVVNDRPPTIDAPAAQVARRFARFETPQNRRFFSALAKYFAAVASDPQLPVWFEFAVTTNERGRRVAALLAAQTSLSGKRCLDVGCAYGGFTVAFAERGATVTGLDINPHLLALARENFADNGLDCPLLLRDAAVAAGMSDMRESFDVVTCNDVIEHVDDPLTLLQNIAAVLRPGGCSYFEIPNRHYTGAVKNDGHFGLFGLTLLEDPDDQEYYELAHPEVRGKQMVPRSLGLDDYRRLFDQAGLDLTLLEATFEGADVAAALAGIQDLRRSLETDLDSVPAVMRTRVAGAVARYLAEAERQPCRTPDEQRSFVLRHGVGFWKVLAHRSG